MNGFIKLPDGAIYNVAHVRKVRQPDKDSIRLYIGIGEENMPEGVINHHDPDGKIYAYFERIARDFS